MRRLLLASIGLVLTGSAAFGPAYASVAAGMPTTAREVLIVQKQQQQAVQLNLVAELREVRKDESGKEIVSWNPLPNNAQVIPQSIIRYTVTAQNNSNRNMRNLIVTQPIPEGMVYILNSATKPAGKGAKVEFSIDGGKTFTERPVIKVRENGKIVEKPAPPEAYTHVRWNFGDTLPANSQVSVSYQVRVK
ncbi:MAG: hypothetical protein NZ901_04585 [Geminocystis sp.]|nr:hypothetical protein [Geminocystis sp.]MCS7147451.1 hypothetical protein [Geminocystis sp.]MDW8115144.1 hypothetical protein [Geminocystis sp.]MDW8464414.1 hypothetical protein [Geminocystis sp.]